MSLLTDRVKLLLDTLKGSEFTNARAYEIVQMYNNSDENTERTVDQEAQLFLDAVINHVKTTARRHYREQLAAVSTATVDGEADTAVGDL